MNDQTVVTRFAPSPTGHLHIGGARTALFCWAFAQRAERAARAKGAAAGTGGRFMIRIEDTDQARSSEESARGILEDLAWLGIEWDDGPALRVRAGEQGGRGAGGTGERVIGANARAVGPYFQAQRVALYDKHLRRLVQEGKAYPAFETSEELEAKRKAVVARKETYRYDRAEYHRLGSPAERLAAMAAADAKEAGTRPYVLRFLMPPEDIVVHDRVLGDVVYKHTEGGIDDFVIRKADGFPTYHFAVVVDDETMGVTHVLRAQEHLNNTPRHVALQRALGFRTPFYAHMPLIFNMDGTKMSKRDKAKTARKALKDAVAKDKGVTPATLAGAVGVAETQLADFIEAENDSLEIATAVAKALGVTLPEIEIWDFRASGYLPEAIVNFVALLGWNPGMKTPDGKDLEKFDREFLAEHFSVERIGKTNAKFDRAKLLSFNADAIAGLSDAEFERRWRAYLGEYEPDVLKSLEARGGAAFSTMAAAVKPRARTLRDGINACRFALVGDDGYAFDPKVVDKVRKADEKNGVGTAGPRSGVDLLDVALERLEGIGEGAWDAGTINGVLEQAAQQLGVGVGQIAQPLRLAVTGTGVSPGIGETLAVLGRVSALARVRRALGVLRV